jgi:two-component system LytT family response regulator
VIATTTKIRALIVDDEAPARARIRQLLKEHPDVELTAECANGRQAVESIQRHQPDLAFLDIQMPGLSGIDVCHAAIASRLALPLVIFVTAYDEYALKAFEVHAIDYLLKPFDRERFDRAIGHAREQLRRNRDLAPDRRLAALLEELKPKRSERLVFRQNGRVIFIRTDSIDWIEADGNYVRIHAGNDAHHFRDTLAGLEAQLPADRFLRISRSVVVNLDRIKEMQPLFYGDYVVILQNGSRLNLSRSFRGKLESILERRA